MSLNPFFIRAGVRTSASANAMIEEGLNPFFIRAGVRTGADRRRALGVGVLIPSSSGRAFGRKTEARSSKFLCLNPFFIRAGVRTAADSGEYMEIYEVLIPSSSGRAFGPRARGGRPGRVRVLIPSSSGRAFGHGRVAYLYRAASLNPFFIRAGVRTLRRARAWRTSWVLIPSSSGRAFGHHGRVAYFRWAAVLIPSSSGRAFGRETAMRSM